MTDKFPEAFSRFEKTVDVDELRFSDIVRAFAEWQGYRPTGKQERCISSEVAGKPKMEFYKQEIHYSWGNRNVFRHKKTGRFYKPI
jgi:hypothetical protein